MSAATPALSADQLVKKFPRVFGDGFGKLPGEYHMEQDDVKSVKYSPRRVPVAIRKRLRETSEDLKSREIVALVTTPTPWLVVSKTNGTLRKVTYLSANAHYDLYSGIVDPFIFICT